MRYALLGHPAQEIIRVTDTGCTRGRGHIPPGGAWYDTLASLPAEEFDEKTATELFARWRELITHLQRELPNTPIRRVNEFRQAHVTGPDGKKYVFQTEYYPRSGWRNWRLVTVPDFLPPGADICVYEGDERLNG